MTEAAQKEEDVGAGSGTISLTLAQVIPSGRVTATDLNPDILPRAAAVARSAGVDNIEFLQADAFTLPFADGTFDVTHCHQMLCHLKSPWEALREMMRVTKVGGVIAAREGDLQTECFWPELEGLVKWHGLAVRLMDRTGSSRAGRQLLSWAMKAGAERGQITPTYGTWFYAQSVDKKQWTEGIVNIIRGGRMRDMALHAGMVTENDLEQMGKDWEEWAGEEAANVAMMHGEILIQK